MHNQRVAVVTASPMTINAFMQGHIRAWANRCHITVFANAPNPTVFTDTELPVELQPVGIERKISPLSDLLALWILLYGLWRGRFHAVVSVTPKAGLLAMLAASVARVPLRIHVFTGQVWATKEGLARRFLRCLDHLTATLATDVLADSESQRQFLIAEGVVSAQRSTVLADGSISGVDVQRFRPDALARNEIRAPLGIAEEDVLLLFLGRLNQDKGVLDLGEAFTRLASTRHQVHLLFVGPDEADMRSRLKQCCSSAAARLHFVEYTERPERFMAAADVFCLPSYREGFGTVVIEAAATGVPAVASKIYGLTDAVIDGETGLLHAPHDIEELGLRLTQLVDDTELRIALGRAAQERARSFFSAKCVTNAFAEYLFQRLEQIKVDKKI